MPRLFSLGNDLIGGLNVHFIKPAFGNGFHNTGYGIVCKIFFALRRKKWPKERGFDL